MVRSSNQEILKTLAFSPSILMEKKELRRFMRNKRRQFDPRAARVKNREIHDRLLSLPEIQNSQHIALYASMPDEAETDSIAQQLLQSGKNLYYPLVIEKNLEFYKVSNLENDLCQNGSFGIREPNPGQCEETAVETIDLFITPGVAFDPFGGRVGFGGGYYDWILSQKQDDAISVALAFEFQTVHAINTQQHDRSVDRIVTEESVYAPHFSTHSCPTEENTQSWARQLLKNGLGNGHTLALHADLGVGKTVFTQGLAAGLGADRDVISPTFIYCREYEGAIPLIHVDAYRLDQVAEGDEQFWDEILERPGIRVIEWAERLGDRLPKNTIHCFGKIIEDNAREWTLFTPLLEHKSLHEG